MSTQSTVRSLASLEQLPALLDLWRSAKENTGELISASEVDWLARVLEMIYRDQAQVMICEEAAQTLGFVVVEENRVLLLWVQVGNRAMAAGKQLLQAVRREYQDVLVEVSLLTRQGIEVCREYGFERVPTAGSEHTQDVQHRWIRLRNDIMEL